jgi:hypothetical protein
VEAREGRGEASQAYVLDIVCHLDEVMPGQENPLRILAEARRKLRSNPRRSGRARTAKKIFVAVETKASVPQTDSGG